MAAAAPYIIMAAGTALSAMGQKKSAAAQKAAANYEAAQMEVNANDALASGQLTAAERRREGAIVTSNARAAMAAGGGVTDDAGALDTLSRIDREGAYNSLATLYDARRRYVGSMAQAAATRMGGKAAGTAGNYAAAGTVLSGASSIYSRRYGGT